MWDEDKGSVNEINIYCKLMFNSQCYETISLLLTDSQKSCQARVWAAWVASLAMKHQYYMYIAAGNFAHIKIQYTGIFWAFMKVVFDI